MESAAHLLNGQVLADGWTVGTKIEMRANHSGSRYSVGYEAHHVSGAHGFVKALDYGSILEEAEDPAREMQEATEGFNAERDLLAHCGERRLSRIIRILGHGTTRVSGVVPSAVSYLILEQADGDAADMRGAIDAGDFLPMLALAHHAGVALAQLHGIGAAHQDVKPSNLLTWTTRAGTEGKLGDLGSAYLPGRPSVNDDVLMPGDMFHAPPEQLYGAPDVLAVDLRRKAADTFMLGDLIAFLLTGVTYNSVFTRMLDADHRWWKWSGTFEEILPALVDVHGRTLRRFREAMHADIVDLVQSVLDELCHPDPRERGSRTGSRQGIAAFDMHRYVTRLDLIRRRAEVAAR